jgi:hydrogenase-4 membrane subunit HyfE
MYFFGLLACPAWVVAALSLLKYLDLSSSSTITLGIAIVLMGVVGIAWFAAKDSAARDAKKQGEKAGGIGHTEVVPNLKPRSPHL